MDGRLFNASSVELNFSSFQWNFGTVFGGYNLLIWWAKTQKKIIFSVNRTCDGETVAPWVQPSRRCV